MKDNVSYSSDNFDNYSKKDEIIDELILDYIKKFNIKVDEMIIGLEYGDGKYEDILTLRYKTKIFKGIDPEFLIELRYGNHLYNLEDRVDRRRFYENNTDLFIEVEKIINSME